MAVPSGVCLIRNCLWHHAREEDIEAQGLGEVTVRDLFRHGCLLCFLGHQMLLTLYRPCGDTASTAVTWRRQAFEVQQWCPETRSQQHFVFLENDGGAGRRDQLSLSGEDVGLAADRLELSGFSTERTPASLPTDW